MKEISKKLKRSIEERGYETRKGEIRFLKYLRDKFREETGDYVSDEMIIICMMIDIYNGKNLRFEIDDEKRIR